MIRWPKKGQTARVHYRKSAATFMPCHGHVGVIQIAGKGPGPLNSLLEIRLPDGGVIREVFARGHLVAVDPVIE